MKGISTVGILILTVFLSISVLPACADDPIDDLPQPPAIVYGHVEDGNGSTVTITANDEFIVVNCDASGWWTADLSAIGVQPGAHIEVSVATASGFVEDTIYRVDAFSIGGMAPALASDADGGSSGNGGDGTYPPGWGETPTPTPAPEPEDTPTSASTDATEPPVTISDDDDAVTPTETATADETDTKTPMGADPVKKTPGFEAVFMIAGLLAAVYLVLHRRE